MGPADKSGRSTSTGEDSAPVNGTRSDGSDADRTTAAPPWQRATSQVRDEPVRSSGQLPDDDYYAAPTNTYEQPTMVQPVAGEPHDELFGSSGRTAVNLGSAGSGSSTGSAETRTRPPSGGTPSALRRPGRGPRRASLQVKRVDPWSVLKLAFVLSVAFFLVLMVAVGVLYAVLDGMGVWDKVNGTYSDLVSGGGGSAAPLISVGRVFAVTAVVGVINIVLFTALSTVGAFVYNVSADLAGGLEVTLAERE